MKSNLRIGHILLSFLYWRRLACPAARCRVCLHPFGSSNDLGNHFVPNTYDLRSPMRMKMGKAIYPNISEL